MAQLQFSAIAPPLDSPGVGTLAARLLSYAATMELVEGRDAPVTLDYDLLLEGAKKVTSATRIGSATIVKLHEKGATEPQRLRDLLTELYEELEESPAPDIEWRPLEKFLGATLLSDLLNISTSSLQRYESGDRPTPDEVADRLHFIALTLSNLAGAYNAFGVRRWFGRPRTPLHGKSPREALGDNWNSDSKAAQQIKRMALSLTSSPAT